MKTVHELAQFLLSIPDQRLDDQGVSKTLEQRLGNNKSINTPDGSRIWVKLHEAPKQA